MAYAKINDNGQLTYATIKNGALITDGKMVWCSESEYHFYGYYPVRNVAEDGIPTLDEEHRVIINYIGAPIAPSEPSEKDLRDADIKSRLDNTAPLLEALERLIAANGVAEEDRNMAQSRIAMRDELGKVIQTEEGDGSMADPYKWVEGMAVETEKWYKTPSNYLWEAKRDGVPSSETDNEYFDVVGL